MTEQKRQRRCLPSGETEKEGLQRVQAAAKRRLALALARQLEQPLSRLWLSVLQRVQAAAR